MTHSNEEIIKSFQLWEEYVDPDMVLTEEEFNNLTLAERLEIILEAFY